MNGSGHLAHLYLPQLLLLAPQLVLQLLVGALQRGRLPHRPLDTSRMLLITLELLHRARAK